jgi:hypothetical protein
MEGHAAASADTPQETQAQNRASDAHHRKNGTRMPLSSSLPLSQLPGSVASQIMQLYINMHEASHQQ